MLSPIGSFSCTPDGSGSSRSTSNNTTGRNLLDSRRRNGFRRPRMIRSPLAARLTSNSPPGQNFSMPPRINTPTSGHRGPVYIPGISLQYLPYSDARVLTVLESAITLVGLRIVRHPPCNRAFALLPHRRTLLSLWGDARIWINFDPSHNGLDYGETTGFDISITEYALLMGQWTTAATLVHELAHIDGASSTDRKAEDTLLRCLLPGLHDPSVIGRILSASRSRLA